MSSRTPVTTLILVAAIYSIGCSGDVHLRRGRSAVAHGEYQLAILALSKAVAGDPDNAGYYRELGVAYFHARQFERAAAALQRARALEPNDGRTLFFLGYSLEHQQRFAEAIEVYAEYRRRSFFDPMVKQMRARITRLSLELAESEVRQAIAREREWALGRPRENTLAVLYFRNVSERHEWDALLKGLSAILTTDLGKVRGLRLVERIKLEALLREITMSTTELYDRFTAPRAGKILGADRVVIGGATAIGSSSLQLDAGVLQTTTSALTGRPIRVQGRLSDILQLEKQIVFALINQLGVRLSKTERESIQKLPTESTLAFVAFCRGLDYADRLNLPAARQAFSEAVRLDPHFDEAQQALEALSTPILEGAELLSLAALDQQVVSSKQHLEATMFQMQSPSETAGPLIPPAQTGRVVVTGRLP